MSMEFSRRKYWNRLLFPRPEDLNLPGIEPWPPALQADSLLSELPGKPMDSERGQLSLCPRSWWDSCKARAQGAPFGGSVASSPRSS